MNILANQDQRMQSNGSINVSQHKSEYILNVYLKIGGENSTFRFPEQKQTFKNQNADKPFQQIDSPVFGEQ